MGQTAKATTVKNTFNRSTTVSISINAEPETIWSLLTNAKDFPRWNSTVVSIDGDIKVGEKIMLKSVLDPSRTFKIKIKEMTPHTKMIWGDALGTRTYTLDKKDNGTTEFTMYEKIGGLMYPLFAKKIPEFDDNFEQYANDLKKEAESKSSNH